jgi:hypothetical protein
VTAAALSALSDATRTVPLAAGGTDSQSGTSLRTLAIAAFFATVTVTAAALAIVAGPFHASLGSL